MMIPVKNKLSKEQLIKISRFKEIIKKTLPHKHEDYYELIFLQHGEGFHWIESDKFLITAPECYILKPGQLHYWQFTSIPKGYVLLVKDDFFDALHEPHVTSLFKNLIKTSHLNVPQNDFIETALEEIIQEQTESSPLSSHIVNGYLRVLFSKMLQYADLPSKKSEAAEVLYESFLKLLNREGMGLHKVSDYADLLNTTPQNLNYHCHKYSSKNAGAHIAGQLMLEAKRLILHTDNTINEIAYALSFNDPSNFVKFFKKNSGLTPVEFRKSVFNSTK